MNRRSMFAAALGALVTQALLVMACQGPHRAPTAPIAPPPSGGSPDAEVAAFVDLVNDHRGSIGATALIWDDRVAQVALAHSQDMATRGFFSHTNPDGLSPFDRLSAAGISYTTAGENIAYGFSSATSVYQAWMGSSGHRANIENPAYTHHGVGRYGTYWTHLFITPTSP